MALFLAMLPLLFVIKIPVLLYVILSMFVLIVNKNISKVLIYFWMLLGLAVVGFSFIGEFNYVGLSRLKIFVSLLISLLIYAVMLQRLTREINVYILVSPGLLLILSFFFFNSITMLFYALSVLFIFVLLLLWKRMESPLTEAFKMSLTLFSMALPMVVILFLVFPRISFEKSNFGFKGEHNARMGHDGTMHLGSEALLVPSKKVVMEVLFDEMIPPDETLYFRGSVLYRDNIDHWRSRIYMKKSSALTPTINPKTEVSYHITLYPHWKKWIYMLDLPLDHPKKSKINSGFIVTYEKNIDEVLRYDGRSALQYRTPLVLEKGERSDALYVDRKRYPLSAMAADKIIRENRGERERASAIITLFKDQNLTYSLRPKPMNMEHLSDAFLFESKVGYCVHFAATFATMARLSHIPARIVTGYKASRKNSVQNYLIVREEDAHAWVELYFEDAGWVRFETTATASHVIYDDQTGGVVDNSTEEKNAVVQTVKLYFMYAKHMIESWILEYSRYKQMTLLKKLLEDTLFLMQFLGAFVMLVALSIAGFTLLQREQCQDDALCAMRPLLKKLAKKGLHKRSSETMEAFLKRSLALFPKVLELERINTLYHHIRYADQKDKATLSELRETIGDIK